MVIARARQSVWAAAFLMVAVQAAEARDACGLSENTICHKFLPALQLSCVKHVQLAVAACLRSKRQERFGSHEDHCRVACRAGFLAFDLEKRLRNDALATVEQSAGGNTVWLSEARSFWREQGTEADGQCSTSAFDEAQSSCARYCREDARQRDLKELQGLAVGEDFLPLKPPIFACPPGAAAGLLGRDDGSLLEWLYPPGHPRRADNAVE